MNERLFILFHKYHRKTISDAEREELFAFMEDEAHEEEVQNLILEAYEHPVEQEQMPEDRANAVFQSIISSQGLTGEEAKLFTMKPMYRWLGIAAAVLVLGLGIGLWYQLVRSEDQGRQKLTANKVKEDISPGASKAFLKINNQPAIDLSGSKRGIVVNKAVTYNDGEKIAEPAGAIQLTTPRGGRYEATLPDGSRVWLNAESSISFPAAFTRKERVVEVEGEVFFDIARISHWPFIVKVNKGQIQIDVLGTKFNLNAYKNEPAVKTSLIDGAIKVKASGEARLLKPGQQLVVADSRKMKVVEKVDTGKVVAWKNGVFNFEGLPFDEVMRQLDRWYDIEVRYEGTSPAMQFRGVLPRDLSLTQLLETLNEVDVKYRLEGRTLIIL